MGRRNGTLTIIRGTEFSLFFFGCELFLEHLCELGVWFFAARAVLVGGLAGEEKAGDGSLVSCHFVVELLYQSVLQLKFKVAPWKITAYHVL